jgi:anti-sigma-K factor RskA
VTDRELVAAYVLGELEAPELAEFELRLAREPELRAEVEATRLLSAGLEALPADAWPGAEWGEARRPRRPRSPRPPAAARAPRRRVPCDAPSAGLPTPWRPSPPRS